MTRKTVVIRGRIMMRIKRPVFASRWQILRPTDTVLRRPGRISRRRGGRNLPMAKFALCGCRGRVVRVAADFLGVPRVIVTASSHRSCIGRG